MEDLQGFKYCNNLALQFFPFKMKMYRTDAIKNIYNECVSTINAKQV